MSIETLAEYASMELLNIKPPTLVKIPKKSILHNLDPDFKTFVSNFITPKGKIPKPIRNVIEWNSKYPSLITVEYVLDSSGVPVLSLCISRPRLIKICAHEFPAEDTRNMEVRLQKGRTKVQNFERGLTSLKNPKLTVFQSTHGHETKCYIIDDGKVRLC